MRNYLGMSVSSGLIALALSGCGGAKSDKDKSAPPPVVPGQSDTLFSLQDGTYFVTSISDVEDGCKKNPLSANDPLTKKPFNLTNKGDGNITISFCRDEKGNAVSGNVRGNTGTLSVYHPGRIVAEVGKFDQECRLDVKLTGDNQFDAHYVEIQSNRNEAVRRATNLPAAECTSTFNFKLARKE